MEYFIFVCNQIESFTEASSRRGEIAFSQKGVKNFHGVERLNFSRIIFMWWEDGKLHFRVLAD